MRDSVVDNEVKTKKSINRSMRTKKQIEMEKLEKYLNALPDSEYGKEYYVRKISELTEMQKAEMEDLVIRLDKAGAKEPLSWAFSEVTENIPQFGRFLVLKKLLEIEESPKDNILIASDFDRSVKDRFLEISNMVGEEKMLEFLTSFSRGIMWQIVELLDDGNENYKEDRVNWVLFKTDENLDYPEPTISGLHESFLEFKNEIKQRE